MMKIKKVNLKNFRRLEEVEIDFDQKETVFVGPNNSGKTSATSAFKLFLKTRDFKIHDFSVSKIADFDKYGRGEQVELPTMEMDLWFAIDPDIEFGRVWSLLPNASAAIEEVGVRIEYTISDADKLMEEYLSAFPELEGGSRAKSLSQYLSLSSNLARHYTTQYFTLEKDGDDLNVHHMMADDARKTLSSILRIDFVDAQRNIDDHDASRSTRLSQAFATYYKMNLDQAEVNEAANRVIDENNENLNEHYEKCFGGLMGILKSLGVPSVNDRELKIVSSLSPEVALKGNTSLLYVDSNHSHELPETYNGLGFKNLVYIAIQVSHYYLQWISTETKRPLCQLIFIEEPEVHLHSSVQQTFISNIWNIIGDVAKQENEQQNIPQISVTTHSSHILDAVDFSKVRYFKRCYLDGEEDTEPGVLNASKVLSMMSFRPERESASGEKLDGNDVIDFLKKYMRLTHCDFFFSDGVILVEGAAEKLLLPKMIEKAEANLKSTYLSVLEVGGAYSSRFAGLLEFLGVPYLVITDIDSVDPRNNRKVCQADKDGSVTSNSSLKFYLGKENIAQLCALSNEQIVVENDSGYIAFQRPTDTPSFGKEVKMFGRTFEEAFIYENIDLFKEGQLSCGKELPDDPTEVKKIVFERVKSDGFKKTDFALDMGATEVDWKVPSYISCGLAWLAMRLGVNSALKVQNNAD